MGGTVVYFSNYTIVMVGSIRNFLLGDRIGISHIFGTVTFWRETRLEGHRSTYKNDFSSLLEFTLNVRVR